MVNAAKKEEKIKAKQQKYMNEKSLDKWDNPQLIQTFGEDQVKKLIQTDK